MSFLVTKGIATKVPIDPINNTSYRYRYYCYDNNPDTLALGYFKESTNTWTYYPLGGTTTQSDWICGNSI